MLFGPPVQILIIRQEGVGLGSVEVAVPHSKHGQDDWDVLVEGRRLEMIVHPVGPGEEMDEIVKPNVKSNRHPDGRPEGVAAYKITYLNTLKTVFFFCV